MKISPLVGLEVKGAIFHQGYNNCFNGTAGAIMYRKYGFLKRFFMKLIASGAGGNTDTSKNYEYTDWDEVEHFTTGFLAQISAAGVSD